MELRCLALFDWSESIDQFELLNVALTMFRAKAPSLGVVTMWKSPGSNGKSLSERKVKELISSKEAFYSLEVCPNGSDDFAYYFCIANSTSGARTLTITLPSEIFGADEAERLSFALAELGELGYGIGFVETAKKNPAFHARGVTHGNPSTKEEEEEADRDSIWFMERISMKGNPPKMRHLSGLLRDVYPLNVLNVNHAKAVIDGQDLVSWIGESKVRGVLTPLSARNLLWVIPAAYLRHIRDSLSKNGLILASAQLK
jgi:hypothetical protein